MTSFIVRDAPMSYTHPGAMMMLRDDGPLMKIGGEDYLSEEEDEDEHRVTKESRSSHGVSGRGTGGVGVAGGRKEIEKKKSDSAYSSFSRSGGMKMGDQDECASTTSSSVPLDPSNQVPIFVAPTEMEFVVCGDSPDGKRVLTLYNPYDYPFEYKVLCTACELYIIEPPSGRVNSKHLVDITIRGRPSLMPNAVHRIKIEVMKIGRNNELLGSKIVPIRTVAYATQPLMGGEPTGVFNRIGEGRRGDERGRERGVGRRMEGKTGNAPDVRIANEPPAAAMNLSLLVIVSALCLLALCLPIQKEVSPSESMIPLYLHISETQRVVAAFILGVCSVLILQPANNR